MMAAPYKVVLTDRASRDLDQVYQWIVDQSPEAAVRWYHGFIDALSSLSEFPERCQLAPESPRLPGEVRQLLYGKRHSYRALFTIIGDRVVVQHIRHAARDMVLPDDLS
ncbi:MAG: type II toxin-antitoxin system RelE/ParE family toxin [Thermoguttaceae bacterium]